MNVHTLPITVVVKFYVERSYVSEIDIDAVLENMFLWIIIITLTPRALRSTSSQLKHKIIGSILFWNFSVQSNFITIALLSLYYCISKLVHKSAIPLENKYIINK